MTGDTALYDLILLGNASRQFHIYSGLTDIGDSHLYHLFNVDLTDLKSGEYTFALVYNTRDDVTYDFRVPILETILHYGDNESIVLKYLQPDTGLLRIGEAITPENIYDEDNNKDNTYYYDD